MASPLDYDPQYQHYWSTEPRDTLFGACHNSFKDEKFSSRLRLLEASSSGFLDKSTFYECINPLSNNKSPGPDGIVNEILRMLSHEIQECIHKLFIMWATRLTPVSWKTSDTNQDSVIKIMSLVTKFVSLVTKIKGRRQKLILQTHRARKHTL
eukprot:1144378-Pelagomonas_calceolata.AAC.2